MTVQFNNLRAGYEEISNEIDSAVLGSLRSGRYVGGDTVEAFEEEFAAYVGARFCVGVGNGLDALRLALLALGIGDGDEVIVPSNTYIATWLAVSQCGARPIPVEPDPISHNIDASLIEAALTPRCKAILPVHLYGQPADMDDLLAVAEQAGLKTVEDAAQAHGARLRGRRIGSHSDAVAWSFYPTKNLGAAGDAGAITTNDEELASRVRVSRNYGSRTRYVFEVQGYNSRLDPVQAAILRVKLAHLDEWNKRRAAIAAAYNAGLTGAGLVTPSVIEGAEPVWHLYVVRSRRRDLLQRRLQEANIETLIHYPVPPYRQPAYGGEAFNSLTFPVADLLASEVLSLPMWPQMSQEAVESVIEAVLEAQAND